MKLNLLLLAPPLALVIMLLVSLGVSGFASLFSAKGSHAAGKHNAYACGQDIKENRVQPDYNEFFPIAFFFTIMHVAALVIATAPKGEWFTPVLFIAVAALSLRVLFRRDEDVCD